MLRLSRAQLREVDRISIEAFGLPGIVLMENAARSAADAIQRYYGPLAGRDVLIASGPGNNGGDGFALARWLTLQGATPRVIYLADALPTGDALMHYRVADAMGVAGNWYVANTGLPNDFDLPPCDLIVDCLYGTGLSRPLLGDFAALVKTLNDSGIPIVAIDVPSGLDCDTGEPLGAACIRAHRTITFVAENIGFANPASKTFTGDIDVGDIGCPREVIERVARGS